MLFADSEFISISRYKTLEGDLLKSVKFEYILKYEHNKSTKAIHRDRILDCTTVYECRDVLHQQHMITIDVNLTVKHRLWTNYSLPT